MSDNSAVVKIIATHTREYNELDKLYKKLGVKHLTLLEVHKKMIAKMAELESQHHDLRAEHTIIVDRATTVKQLYTQKKGENKKLKVLLEVAKKEIKKQRVDIVEDLKNFDWYGNKEQYFGLIKKWEAKK